MILLCVRIVFSTTLVTFEGYISSILDFYSSSNLCNQPTKLPHINFRHVVEVIMDEGGSDKIDELSEKQRGKIRKRNRRFDWQGINAENLGRKNLKEAIGCKKGVVTKVQREIRELMKDQANVSVLKEKLEQLKKAFKEFVSAHATTMY